MYGTIALDHGILPLYIYRTPCSYCWVSQLDSPIYKVPGTPAHACSTHNLHAPYVSPRRAVATIPAPPPATRPGDARRRSRAEGSVAEDAEDAGGFPRLAGLDSGGRRSGGTQLKANSEARLACVAPSGQTIITPESEPTTWDDAMALDGPSCRPC